MSDEILITVTEAARRLGLGRSMTYRYVQSGDLPSLKIGGARRILVADLHEFVRRMKERTADE